MCVRRRVERDECEQKWLHGLLGSGVYVFYSSAATLLFRTTIQPWEVMTQKWQRGCIYRWGLLMCEGSAPGVLMDQKNIHK